MDKIRFGIFLTELRKEKDFSQQDLANLLFLTPQSVSKWERGESLPDIESLEKLSLIYQISIDHLLQCKKEVIVVIQEPIKPMQEKAVQQTQFSDIVRSKRFFSTVFGASFFVLSILLYFLPIVNVVFENLYVRVASFNLYHVLFASNYLIGNIVLFLSTISKFALFILSIFFCLPLQKQTLRTIFIIAKCVAIAFCSLDIIFFCLIIKQIHFLSYFYVLCSIAFVVLYFVLPKNKKKYVFSDL